MTPPEPGPRWLDEDESRTWVAWILSTRLLWDELERDLQRDASMPFSYYEVLVMLSQAPDRSWRMSDLADATQSSRSRISHAVTRLEGLGCARPGREHLADALSICCGRRLGGRRESKAIAVVAEHRGLPGSGSRSAARICELGPFRTTLRQHTYDIKCPFVTRSGRGDWEVQPLAK